MNRPLFILQDRLEQLVSQGKVHLDGLALTIRQADTSYKLIPAVKILSCEGDNKDPIGITGKVVPVGTLNKQGAVVYLNSATINSHSYLIDHGYLCYKNPKELSD